MISKDMVPRILSEVFFVITSLVVDHATETRVACFMLVHVRKYFQVSKSREKQRYGTPEETRVHGLLASSIIKMNKVGAY